MPSVAAVRAAVYAPRVLHSEHWRDLDNRGASMRRAVGNWWGGGRTAVVVGSDDIPGYGGSDNNEEEWEVAPLVRHLLHRLRRPVEGGADRLLVEGGVGLKGAALRCCPPRH
jgi:hypothetical protein